MSPRLQSRALEPIYFLISEIHVQFLFTEAGCANFQSVLAGYYKLSLGSGYSYTNYMQQRLP
jgi:hypothetical protein